MQLHEQLQEIPRTVVRVWLRTARLPLQAVEVVAHRGDHGTEWPPALAFESFEAQVKQVAGSVLRDDALVEEGRLTEAKVVQLRKAATLETVAERRKATADAKLAAQRESAGQRRRRVEHDATKREAALERERAAKKHRVEREAGQKKQAAARAETARSKALERQERAAAKTRVEQERAALRKERTAVAKKQRVTKADKDIRATKAVRKAMR